MSEAIQTEILIIKIKKLLFCLSKKLIAIHKININMYIKIKNDIKNKRNFCFFDRILFINE